MVARAPGSGARPTWGNTGPTATGTLVVSSIARVYHIPTTSVRQKQIMRLLLDCSLSLINRTGAHYIAEDLASAFGSEGIIRRWRLFGRQLPTDIVRKICGRLMLQEITRLGQATRFLWPEPKP